MGPQGRIFEIKGGRIGTRSVGHISEGEQQEVAVLSVVEDVGQGRICPGRAEKNLQLWLCCWAGLYCRLSSIDYLPFVFTSSCEILTRSLSVGATAVFRLQSRG